MLLNLKGKIFLWSLVKLLMGTCKRWKAFYKSQLPSDGYLFKGKSKIRVASIGRFMVFTLKWLFYWKNVSSQWLLLCDSLISSYDCRKMSVFGFFMARILPNSYWIRKDTPYLSVFSPNARKFGPEKFRIRTLFTPCISWIFLYYKISCCIGCHQLSPGQYFAQVIWEVRNIKSLQDYNKATKNLLILYRIWLVSK